MVVRKPEDAGASPEARARAGSCRPKDLRTSTLAARAAAAHGRLAVERSEPAGQRQFFVIPGAATRHDDSPQFTQPAAATARHLNSCEPTYRSTPSGA